MNTTGRVIAPTTPRPIARVECALCGRVVARRSTWVIRREPYCIRHFTEDTFEKQRHV